MTAINCGGPGHKVGTVGDRVGSSTKRAIRDVFSPDGAGDERLDDLIEQLRQLNWNTPTQGGPQGAPTCQF